MKFLNFLNEKYLMGEFSFGFELEAFIKRNELPNEYYTELEEILSSKFIKIWPKNFPKISKENFGKDASLSSKDGESFEFRSPILKITPNNIKELVEFLSNLNSINVFTNVTCGFHVHFSFPYISDVDLRWLLINIAVNDSYSKKFLYFKEFKFWNQDHASNEILQHIKYAYEDKDLFELKRLGDYKHNIIRLHPQGTLEWRGPRSFLDKPEKNKIKDFCYNLVDIYQIFSEILNKNTLGWLEKKSLESFPKIISKKINDQRFEPDVQPRHIKKLFDVFPWAKKVKFEKVFFFISQNDDGLFFTSGKIYNFSEKNEKNVFFHGILSFENCKFYNEKNFPNPSRDCIFKDCELYAGNFRNEIFEDCLFDGCYIELPLKMYNCTFKSGKFTSTNLKKDWMNKGNVWISGEIYSYKFDKFIESKIDPMEFLKLEEKSNNSNELRKLVLNSQKDK